MSGSSRGGAFALLYMQRAIIGRGNSLGFLFGLCYIQNMQRESFQEESEDLRFQVEGFYSARKITNDSIQKWLTELKANLGTNHVRHEESFYITSSDSLESLYKIEGLKDERVLTVAGSGEFAQIFVDRGARQVDIVDYSLPACFFAELKVAAASNLSLEEYLKMFGTLDSLSQRGRQHERSAENIPIFDRETYKHSLRSILSEQARTFFDFILASGNEDIATVQVVHGDIVSSDKHWSGFLRFRENEAGKYESLSGRLPFLEDAAAYAEFQEKMRQANITIRWSDLVHDGINGKEHDYVYLSNATYGEQIKEGVKILKGGTQRVGFSAQPYSDLHAHSSSKKIDRSGNIYEAWKEVPDDVFVRPVQLYEDVGSETSEEILPGKTIKYSWKGQKGVIVRVVAVDPAYNYGYLLEIRREDNMQLFK